MWRVKSPSGGIRIIVFLCAINFSEKHLPPQRSVKAKFHQQNWISHFFTHVGACVCLSLSSLRVAAPLSLHGNIPFDGHLLAIYPAVVLWREQREKHFQQGFSDSICSRSNPIQYPPPPPTHMRVVNSSVNFLLAYFLFVCALMHARFNT